MKRETQQQVMVTYGTYVTRFQSYVVVQLSVVSRASFNLTPRLPVEQAHLPGLSPWKLPHPSCMSTELTHDATEGEEHHSSQGGERHDQSEDKDEACQTLVDLPKSWSSQTEQDHHDLPTSPLRD